MMPRRDVAARDFSMPLFAFSWYLMPPRWCLSRFFLIFAIRAWLRLRFSLMFIILMIHDYCHAALMMPRHDTRFAMLFIRHDDAFFDFFRSLLFDAIVYFFFSLSSLMPDDDADWLRHDFFAMFSMLFRWCCHYWYFRCWLFHDIIRRLSTPTILSPDIFLTPVFHAAVRLMMMLYCLFRFRAPYWLCLMRWYYIRYARVADVAPFCRHADAARRWLFDADARLMPDVDAIFTIFAWCRLLMFIDYYVVIVYCWCLWCRCAIIDADFDDFRWCRYYFFFFWWCWYDDSIIDALLRCRYIFLMSRHILMILRYLMPRRLLFVDTRFWWGAFNDTRYFRWCYSYWCHCWLRLPDAYFFFFVMLPCRRYFTMPAIMLIFDALMPLRYFAWYSRRVCWYYFYALFIFSFRCFDCSALLMLMPLFSWCLMPYFSPLMMPMPALMRCRCLLRLLMPPISPDAL